MAGQIKVAFEMLGGVLFKGSSEILLDLGSGGGKLVVVCEREGTIAAS